MLQIPSTSTRHRARALALAGLAVAVLLMALSPAMFGAGRTAAAADSCQTSFIVFTDPANPGSQSVQGKVTFVQDSGVLGSYLDGRLAGYAIAGQQDITINGVTNRAQLHGSFTATSPDGQSSISLRYTGRADLNTGQATGSFVVFDGTGSFAGYRTAGKIEAQLVGPATFEGVDIRL